MGQIIFLTGPVRSGKSRRAVEIAQAWGQDVVFVATYHADATDAEMTVRVARHRAERPSWRTLEAPDDIAATLAALDYPPAGVVIDCLTLWVSGRLEMSDDVILAAWSNQLRRLQATREPIVIVGNEIGWSPVPEHPVLRRFRDLTGLIAQMTAAAANEAWLLVAGCPIRLK